MNMHYSIDSVSWFF